jgi:hypothetical protein
MKHDLAGPAKMTNLYYITLKSDFVKCRTQLNLNRAATRIPPHSAGEIDQAPDQV